ncbi:glycosyltransferase family 4 protein [Ramlibacter albus]|uniref:Glycosyltransferase n=1 Tax=Ramlibacter albus TaxID=2079448 RepID=A0A923S2G7_9BURK|nr:glycosyltransferase family 4 protein [Ramlibacter albus]MBC5764738.1 glycosyltransferase [Ramlibacter albus]
MRLLFVHQNFPGQFKHLAPALAARGHEVVAMTMKANQPAQWNGVRLVPYAVGRASTPGIHPWLIDVETKVIRGEAAYRAALQMREQGYTPDAIVAHPGWGESLFIKDVWPQARLGIYAEFHYHPEGADLGFDPEFPGTDDASAPRMRVKNINNLLHFEVADAGLSPTRWQADAFPGPFRDRITVVHDGIDTAALAPNPGVKLALDGHELTRADEVVTFVNRNLEPYRGYHVFMRSLPTLLRERPNARVLIVGGTATGYGRAPPQGTTWRDVFLAEVRPRLREEDLKRIHFLGSLPYDKFVALLQLSTVHVYLTYPFVLSWSLLEAMSIGCAVVASDTAPVREAIRDGDNGVLVPFFEPERLAGEIARLLADPAARGRLGAKARSDVIERYDLLTRCLPAQVAWVEGLAR